MTRHVRVVCHLFAIVLASGVWWLPADAFAQAGDEAFKDGLEARDDKKWAQVIEKMRQAVQQEGTEATRKVQGSRSLRRLGARTESEYLPRFYLGEALLQTGDCDGAIDQWEISQGQGAVQSRQEFVKAIQDGYRTCNAKGILPPAELSAARESTRQAIEQAEASEKRTASLAQGNRDLARPDTIESLEGTRREIAEARTRLSAGEKNRAKAEFTDAQSRAERARATLVSIESSLNAAIGSRNASVNQLAADADKAIAGARETDRAIDATNFQLTEALRSSRQASLAQLETATGRLEGGRRGQNQAALTEARNLANEASRGLTQVLEGVRTAIKEAAEKLAADALRHELDQAIVTGRQAVSFAEASFARLVERLQKRPDRATPELTTQRDDLEKRVTDLRPRLDREGEARNLTAVRSVTRSANSVRASLDKLTESFGAVTIEEQVGTALYAAVRSFLEGDYANTIATIDSSKAPADGPLQAHVHLFKAASLFALYVRSGEKDQSLLTQANGEIGRGKALDPGLEPDRRVFSPRFVSAYRSGGVQPAAAPATAPAR